MKTNINGRITFMVNLPDYYGVPSSAIRSVQLPSYKVNVESKFDGKNDIYSPASGGWDFAVFELYDFIMAENSKYLINAIEELDKLRTDSKSSKLPAYEEVVEVKIISDGDVLETWELTGFLVGMYFGSYTWDNDHPAIYQLQFKVNSVKIK